jgi:hypothetical protein
VQISEQSAIPQHGILIEDELSPSWRVVRTLEQRGPVQAFGGTLDSITGQVVGMLRRSPLIRLLAVMYLMSIHVYVYFLIGHMQRESLHRVQTLPLASHAKNHSHSHVAQL